MSKIGQEANLDNAYHVMPSNTHKTVEEHRVVITHGYPAQVFWGCAKWHEHRFRFMMRLCNYFTEIT